VPQVIAAYSVSGDADAMLHMRTRDTAELELAIEHIRAHPKAERTKTVIVLSRLLGPGTPTPSAPPAAGRRRRR
jgi:DNA-binding Lrp family transcriptional regulator